MDDGPRRIVDRGHYVAPIFALAAIGGALAFTYASLGIHLIQQWRDDDTYSHGFIVVPIALYFAWQRRNAVQDASPRPTAWGLAVLWRAETDSGSPRRSSEPARR